MTLGQDRPGLLPILALVAALVVVAAVVLWQLGGRPGATPPPPDSPLETSPLPSPTVVAAEPSSPAVWYSRGAALLWVVVGIFLALGIAFLILRRHSQDT